MAQLRKSFEWLRSQWNAGGAAKKSVIVIGLLCLWPLVFMFALVALVFEVVASLDRGGRLSPNAHWAVATLLVVGGLVIASAMSPGPETPTVGEVSIASATPSEAPTREAPTSSPTATPRAAASEPASVASTEATPAQSSDTTACAKPGKDVVGAIEAGMTYGNQHLESAWIVAPVDNGQYLVVGIAMFANGNDYVGTWAVDASGSVSAVSDWADVYGDFPVVEEPGDWRSEDHAQRVIDQCSGG